MRDEKSGRQCRAVQIWLLNISADFETTLTKAEHCEVTDLFSCAGENDKPSRMRIPPPVVSFDTLALLTACVDEHEGGTFPPWHATRTEERTNKLDLLKIPTTAITEFRNSIRELKGTCALLRRVRRQLR